MAALTFMFVSSQTIAQPRDGQQACEGDVYELCGDKIPDEDEIVACLRKKWKKVSKECRHVMATYAKTHSKTKRHKDRNGGAGNGRDLAN